MAVDGAASLFAVAMRVVKLGADGSILAGAGNMYVSDAMTEIPIGHEYEDGDEVTLKNAAGRVCVTYRAPDTLKRGTFEVTLCSPDDALEAMLTGGSILLDGAEVIGYAPPAVGSEPNPNGVGIEVWTRAIVDGAAAATDPYWRWVFPRVKGLRHGDMSLNADPTQPTFTGFLEQNAAYDDGPLNDIVVPTTRIWQRFRDTAHPTPALGAQATPAQPSTGSVQGP